MAILWHSQHQAYRALGSSPSIRGASHAGLIVTCREYEPATGGEAHPHIQGAYSRKRRIIETANGSPPHTGSLLVPAYILSNPTRLTPTYRELTDVGCAGYCWCGAHPHIQGAYRTTPQAPLLPPGSPPHTGSLPDIEGSLSVGSGLTPTYRELTLPD